MCEEQKKTSRKKCNTLTTIYEHLLHWNAWKRIVAHNKTTLIFNPNKTENAFQISYRDSNPIMYQESVLQTSSTSGDQKSNQKANFTYL